MTNRFSPVIAPTKYERPDREVNNVIRAIEYGNWTLDTDKVSNLKLATKVDDDMVMLYTDNGSVYIGDGHCHVAESVYRSNSTVFLREKVLSALVLLDDAGIVEGLEVVDERKIRGVSSK